ncbi:hypothetical protein GA0070612_2754 [Micromonospora chokoriensis]|uniref:Uncharacterized protein n=2 Tax=Micromonospora chokoriensis TaxID=356851 RepID=A0A1C4WRK1_9ACTN|nr:hypothetical protein GA0070612_2754 [Micromonospora chokoriensis]
MVGSDLAGPDLYGREMRLWQSLGPTTYRLRSACLAALLALASVLVFLGAMTVVNQFGGVHYGQPARVVAGACQQIGPISRRGFGYWWECDAAVIASDGTARKVRVHSSGIVPEDQGSSVELRETCRTNGDVTDCSYGKPIGWLLHVGLGLIVCLGWLALAFGAAGVVMFLTRALLGAPRYLRFRGHVIRPRK